MTLSGVGRIDGDAGSFAKGADHLQGAVEMGPGLGMGR